MSLVKVNFMGKLHRVQVLESDKVVRGKCLRVVSILADSKK